MEDRNWKKGAKEAKEMTQFLKRLIRVLGRRYKMNIKQLRNKKERG